MCLSMAGKASPHPRVLPPSVARKSRALGRVGSLTGQNRKQDDKLAKAGAIAVAAAASSHVLNSRWGIHYARRTNELWTI